MSSLISPLTQVKQAFSEKLSNLVGFIRGYEESGNIAVDSISLKTRDALKASGVL